ncbi:MAG: 4Fe-4S dicluster domain-containing protein, partial [Xanthomonadales bacterium]|nr:4Fe-4S dicluster domain-containing protein [Xanthomonadales bacterium]
VLVDTTRCIGCRACEVACSEEHDMFVPDVVNDGALEENRKTSDKQWTVVNKFKTEKGDIFVKRQCMHCYQAACATACPTEAMKQMKGGPVIWRGNKCIGCRFCMVSCPFDIPKFEYGEWNPKLQKCTMCFERLEEGQKPACVEACPTDTLMFGSRLKNLEVARHRIYSHPDKYVHHIYGEHEVGGTGYIYLSAVPFEQIGFRTDLGKRPYPEYTKEFLYAVPMILFGVPAFLLGLNTLTDNNKPTTEDEFHSDVEGVDDEY